MQLSTIYNTTATIHTYTHIDTKQQKYNIVHTTIITRRRRKAATTTTKYICIQQKSNNN